jgi:hypothetical protein
LRQARIQWHANQVEVLVRFLENWTGKNEKQDPDLDFLIALLPEMLPDQDPDRFFNQKKAFYLQALAKAETFERKRRTDAMEILMMQGYRAVQGSVESWRRQIQTVDRLCRTLFGHTMFVDHAMPYRITISKSDA